jgi:hypothetical protein
MKKKMKKDSMVVNQMGNDEVEHEENDQEWNVTKSKKLSLCQFERDRWRG